MTELLCSSRIPRQQPDSWWVTRWSRVPTTKPPRCHGRDGAGFGAGFPSGVVHPGPCLNCAGTGVTFAPVLAVVLDTPTESSNSRETTEAKSHSLPADLTHSRRVATEGQPGGPVELSPDAIVVRFRPTAEDAVLKQAEKERNRPDGPGRPRLSVFADVVRDDESRDDTIKRLVVAAGLAGLDLARNKKFYICGAAGGLQNSSFGFYKDGDGDEVDEHYSIDLGDNVTPARAAEFLGHFDEEGQHDDAS